MRYPEAEIAYDLWMKGLQKAAKSAGSTQTTEEESLADRELAECVSEYMDVLEEQVCRGALSFFTLSIKVEDFLVVRGPCLVHFASMGGGMALSLRLCVGKARALWFLM